MTATTILIADDDQSIRTVLTQALARQGHAVRATDLGSTLWHWVAAGEGDLVITDVVMPDENGLDLLPRIRAARPGLPVIVMSAQSTLMTAVRAAEGGAFEYLPKPFDLDELIGVIDRALSATGGPTQAPDEPRDDEVRLVGTSAAMQGVFRTIARLSGTDVTALIVGESGTGKELIARALHRYGKRRRGPFVAVNMAAIPRELIESELFGHERGAFTGAAQRREGRFAEARGGTLFLDEIGDMPMEAQTRLLRVLQGGGYTPVGGRGVVAADVRIVAATNHDLAQLTRQGRFREDLYYRLNVVPLRVPPLRERREDIPSLVRHLIALATREGLEPKDFAPAALDRLRAHVWPGNVRELDNVIRRLLLLGVGDVVEVADVKRELGAGVEAGEGLAASVERHLKDYFAAHGGDLPIRGLYDRVIREVERPLLALALAATRGNQIRAAAVLGLNRNTLRKKIRELGVSVPRGPRP
ncbi:MAG: nitrogen regulation protein NR(I) [Alphaproteobacteria bacterium]|nr:nitrogen regulation protein NR(I) [Alphaproteobacteria bacterium]